MTTKQTAILYSILLINAIIAFPTIYAETTQQPTLEDLLAKEQLSNADIQHIKELPLKTQNEYITALSTTKVTDQNKETYEQIISSIISKDTELSFGIDEKATFSKPQITANTIQLTVDDKTFTINTEELPTDIIAINVTTDGIRYTTKTGNKIELTEPKQKITFKDDTYTLTTQDDKKVTFKFNKNGRVKPLPNGEVLFSGDAEITSDIYTATMKDTAGKPGYIIPETDTIQLRTEGNNILLTQTQDEISFDIKQTPEDYLHISTQDGIEAPNPNPNGFYIDPKNKKIFIPESDDAIGHITSENTDYRLYGLDLPSEGVRLDTSFGFSGGDISQIQGDKGEIKPGGFSTGNPIGTGGGFGGGNNNGGSNGGLFGGVNSLLPLLLIGGGVLAAILLLNNKEQSNTNEPTIQDNQDTEIDYPEYNTDYQVTTGQARNTNTQQPIVQSPYTTTTGSSN